MTEKRKEYLKKWREDNKEHIRKYKKEYAKTHDSSFKKLQDKCKQLQQENEQLKDNWNMLKEHLTNRYNNGTESISYRQVFIEIREAMQVLEIQQELEKGDLIEK